MTDGFLRNNYVPSVYQKDIYSIDYDKLKNHGIKVISFDIDETIAGDNEELPSKTVITLIENLKQKGFEIMLLTNANTERAKTIGNKLDCKYIANAEKPLTKNFKNIIAKFNIKPSQMTHIGNSQFDDVAGGNTIGIVTCLILNKSGKKYSKEEELLKKELSKRNIWKDSKFYQLKEKR